MRFTLWRALWSLVFLGLAFAIVPSQKVALGRSAPSWIDISVGVVPGETPIYPGDPPAEFTWFRSIARGDIVNLSDLHMGAHTGTHIDAPLHFIAGGATIDQIPLEKLIGPARIIECSPEATIIDTAELQRHNWKGAKRILFKTRNSYSNFWADKQFHPDFTALAPEAARLLVEAGVELVGIDYHSIEKFGSPQPLTHRALLAKNTVVVEALDLRKASAGDYDLVCLPAKLVGREGAPTRAAVRARK
jgi:arylformamidase